MPMRPPRVRVTMRRIVLGAIALGVLACVAAYRFSDDFFHTDELVAEFGGAHGFDVVAHPDRVEAFRLAPIPEPILASPGALDDLENFPAASGPVPVPTGLTASLSADLTSPRSYLWGIAKGCGVPTPGVRLSFVRGRDRVDILLCLRCSILLIYRDGRRTGGGSFDPVEEPLARAIKSLFPDDPAIQAIGSRDEPHSPL